jgi:hypothetical protein
VKKRAPSPYAVYVEASVEPVGLADSHG